MTTSFQDLTGQPDALLKSLTQIAPARSQMATRLAAVVLSHLSLTKRAGQAALEVPKGNIETCWSMDQTPHFPMWLERDGHRYLIMAMLDNSALVGRVEMRGLGGEITEVVRFLPWVFAMRSKPVGGGTGIKVARTRGAFECHLMLTPPGDVPGQGEVAISSFAFNGGTVWKTGLVEARGGLLADLDRLAPAFETAPALGDMSHGGLIDRGALWPDFLRQKRYLDTETGPAVHWLSEARDTVAWLAEKRHDFRRGTLALKSALPGEGPFLLSFHDTTVQILGTKAIEKLRRDVMELMPYSGPNLVGFGLSTSTDASRPAILREEIATTRFDAEALSAHRRISLEARARGAIPRSRENECPA